MDGLAEDGALRCPWHHAAFDLATGEAWRAPAFASLAGKSSAREKGYLCESAGSQSRARQKSNIPTQAQKYFDRRRRRKDYAKKIVLQRRRGPASD
ncbi:MAG: hypothetical protein C0511_14040 [Hyphomicrobium sp.]|nr:hypothetical protein [Hyphomicrobium sp.]